MFLDVTESLPLNDAIASINARGAAHAGICTINGVAIPKQLCRLPFSQQNPSGRLVLVPDAHMGNLRGPGSSTTYGDKLHDQTHARTPVPNYASLRVRLFREESDQRALSAHKSVVPSVQLQRRGPLSKPHQFEKRLHSLLAFFVEPRTMMSRPLQPEAAMCEHMKSRGPLVTRDAFKL